MSVPRPAMFVAMVTAPGSPASATMAASRSWFLALSTLWWMPLRSSIPESASEVSTEAVPASTGCPRVCASLIASTTDLNLACSERKMRSARSSRIMGRWVGTTITSSE